MQIASDHDIFGNDENNILAFSKIPIRFFEIHRNTFIQTYFLNSLSILEMKIGYASLTDVTLK